MMCHWTRRWRSRAASWRRNRQSCWHRRRWWLVEYVAMHLSDKNMCDWLRSRACPWTGDCQVWRRVAWRDPPLEQPSPQRWSWWRPRKNESVARNVMERYIVTVSQSLRNYGSIRLRLSFYAQYSIIKLSIFIVLDRHQWSQWTKVVPVTH